MNEEQKISFISALKDNNLSRIKIMLAQDSAILDERLNQDGSNAIHLAAQHSAIEITAFLIYTYHATNPTCFLFFVPARTWLNQANRLGETPLQLAIMHNQNHNIRPLFHAGATLKPTFIHIAASMGYLEIIKKLLDINPSLLNIFDEDGQTPLIVAICNPEALAVVAFLLQEGANPNTATHCPGHSTHNKIPLTWAIESKNYQAIHWIIQKTLTPENQHHIFNFINSAEQAFELMKLSTHHTQLMLKNPKIKQLVQARDRNTSATSIGFYQLASEQRSSFFADINPETGAVDIFHPHGSVGTGAYGCVRSFINKEKKIIAIKAPHELYNVTKVQAAMDEIRDYKKEVHLMTRAYNLTSCRLFSFVTSNKKAKMSVNLRCIMPYVPGKRIDEFIKRTRCYDTIARCILETTKALMSLHKKNIIHGDVKPDNILVATIPRLTVTLVDFGLSYDIRETQAVSFKRTERTSSTNYIAPERFYSSLKIIPPPHTSQDVFSLGHMLLYNLIPQNEKKIELNILYPCIQSFIQCAVSSQPHQRPTLTSFHEELSHAIDERTHRLSMASTI